VVFVGNGAGAFLGVVGSSSSSGISSSPLLVADAGVCNIVFSNDVWGLGVVVGVMIGGVGAGMMTLVGGVGRVAAAC
jgi:hypothetical protein